MPSDDSIATRGVGIDCLPDELLSRVLTHLNFCTKLQSHRVCRRWDEVLKHPCYEALWGSVPRYKLSQDSTKDDIKIGLYTSWLADRAAGIQAVAMGAGRLELNCQNCPVGLWNLFEKQLPFMLGRLHIEDTNFDISLGADPQLMTSPLLTHPELSSCMSQNLVALTITACPACPKTIDLDRLSSMVKLQLLDITGTMQGGAVWSSKGQLSLLTSLQTFEFQFGNLQGPVLPALGTLPHLTRLVTESVPENTMDLGGTTYSALEELDISVLDSVALFTLHIPNTANVLRRLFISDCEIAHDVLPLKLLCRLEQLALSFIEISTDQFLHEHEWWSDAFQGLTSMRSLSLCYMQLTRIPESILDMTGLQDLCLDRNGISDLPAAFAQLSHLTFFSLDESTMSTMPKVMSQMTNLCHLSLLDQKAMWITQPLIYLTTFSHLTQLHLSRYCGWDPVSMFYLGQMTAALGQAFRNGLLASMPILDLKLNV